MDLVITTGALNVILALAMTLSLGGVHYFFNSYRKELKKEKEEEKRKKDNTKEIKSIQ